MKRINVDIDDELMQKALRMSGLKTKKELVNTSLRYYRDLLLRQKAEKEENNKNENER
jgi:Arc/MetJ family transcription regulator